MSEWKEYQLGEIGFFNNGVNKSKSSFGHGYPFVNLLDLFENDRIEKIPKGLVAVNQDELHRYDLKEGDILFVRSSVKLEGVGKVSTVLSDLENTIYSGFIIRFRQLNQVLEKIFSSYYLNSAEIRSQVITKGTLSANSNINQESLKSIQIKIPSLPVQTKIAKILSTADTVIEKTQAAIAKYKAIKQGMLQDLFTRGINITTNKLRPRFEDAPQLYRESKLGMIPREWEVERLGNLCSEKPTYGINAAAVEFTHKLPTYIRITDINENGDFSKTGRKCVDSVFTENYILKKGDLVFARTGASVGKTYLYNETDGVLVYAGFLIKVSPNEKVLDSNFLKFLTETSYYLNWVGLMSQRSAQPGINGIEYGNLLIPKLDLEEQNLITEKLKSIQRKLQTEETYLHKMQSLKKGLMEDLLSGKKCLNLDLQDEQMNKIDSGKETVDNPINPKIK